MKAKETNFLEFLRGPKQFAIPIYQRTYSWSKKQCRQLWNDIVQVANNDDVPAHFIGSIVYITEGIYQATGIPRMLVIDGQQRLTTLSLLLKAIIYAMDMNGSSEAKRLKNYFLVNNEEEGELHYKLILTRSDKETYIKIVDDINVSDNVSTRVWENYTYFQSMVESNDINPELLYKGISKLLIVDVSLDRTHDNPQLIFESLNSTGLDLSQADLIRNYVLMGLKREVQEDLYKRYWYPMEQSFGYAEYSALFDRFMRDYLTIRSEVGYIPALRNVYSQFKSYSFGKNIEQLVGDVYKFSEYFVKLAFPERNDDKEIANILRGINTLKVDVAYPLLIEVYNDYEEHSLLSKDDFVEILRLVESYVLRRAICGIPTNSMNKTFATFKRSIDKSDYLNSVKYALYQLNSYRRFPTDEEFKQSFIAKDVYNLRQRRNYILSHLENYERKELINIEEYTIEHILPQNPKLSSDWQQNLGENWKEKQAKYLHTIGNLTLTGYNSELSDKSFKYKRDVKGGFADSPLRLNYGLSKLEIWGVNEITERAEALAEKAIMIWGEPQLSDEVVQIYDEKNSSEVAEYSLEEFDYLQGEMRELYNVLEKRIMNLDSVVQRDIKKLYIAFKTTTNFVDIVPQKKRLRLTLNMDFEELDDPKQIALDVTDLGRWGNGNVEIGFANLQDIEYIMFLIRQSFEKHTDMAYS